MLSGDQMGLICWLFQMQLGHCDNLLFRQSRSRIGVHVQRTVCSTGIGAIGSRLLWTFSSWSRRFCHRPDSKL
jgi:hypothetical protein